MESLTPQFTPESIEPMILFGTPGEPFSPLADVGQLLGVSKKTPKERKKELSTTALDFRIKYQQLHEEREITSLISEASMFPLEGVYGGMPLLLWNEREEQKFLIVIGYGIEYEENLVRAAQRGEYERTKTVDCRANLKDPPIGSIETNARILMSLADEIEGYWRNGTTENIVVLCFAGQNRSMAATLLFLMTRAYKQRKWESTEVFARRILTLLSASRPSAFVSIPDALWIGERKTKGYRLFNWFELVVYAYEEGGKDVGTEVFEF